jgi:hypothetical protein
MAGKTFNDKVIKDAKIGVVAYAKEKILDSLERDPITKEVITHDGLQKKPVESDLAKLRFATGYIDHPDNSGTRKEVYSDHGLYVDHKGKRWQVGIVNPANRDWTENKIEAAVSPVRDRTTELEASRVKIENMRYVDDSGKTMVVVKCDVSDREVADSTELTLTVQTNDAGSGAPTTKEVVLKTADGLVIDKISDSVFEISGRLFDDRVQELTAEKADKYDRYFFVGPEETSLVAPSDNKIRFVNEPKLDYHLPVAGTETDLGDLALEKFVEIIPSSQTLGFRLFLKSAYNNTTDKNLFVTLYKYKKDVTPAAGEQIAYAGYDRSNSKGWSNTGIFNLDELLGVGVSIGSIYQVIPGSDAEFVDGMLRMLGDVSNIAGIEYANLQSAAERIDAEIDRNKLHPNALPGEYVDLAVQPDDDFARSVSYKRQEKAVFLKDVTDAHAAEVQRATEAENTLTANLDAEVTRATDAEGTRKFGAEGDDTQTDLTTAIKAETSRAMAAETTNAGAIVTEEGRAKAAEEKLTDGLADEKADREKDVNDEETRAKEAETILTNSLNAEVSRAKTAEEANAVAILNEETRAKGEEARIEGKFDTLSGGLDVVGYSQTKDNDAGKIDKDSDVIRVEDLSKTGHLDSATAAINYEVNRASDAEGDRIFKAGEMDTTQGKVPYYERLDLTTAILNETEDRITDVNKEKVRAEAAELTLTTNLASEVTTARSEESRIETKVDSNKALADTKMTKKAVSVSGNGRQQLLQAIQVMPRSDTEVSFEQVSADVTTDEPNELVERFPMKVSGDLKMSLDQSGLTLSADILKDGLAKEVARATTAEGERDTIEKYHPDGTPYQYTKSLTEMVHEEVARATEAETLNAQAIVAEHEDRTTEQGSLTDLQTTDKTTIVAAINSENSERKSADTSLGTRINKEIDDRKDEVVRMESLVEAEETRAQGAETTLQSNINSEATTRSNADSTLQASIDSEASTRNTDDLALGARIDKEISDRITADSTLHATITGETTAAILVETDRAKAAEDAERARAIAAEGTRNEFHYSNPASGVDENPLNQYDLTTLVKNTRQMILDGEGSRVFDESLQQIDLTKAIKNETTRAKTAEGDEAKAREDADIAEINARSTAISTEQGARIAADEAELNRATAEEARLNKKINDDVAAETTRATAAEGDRSFYNDVTQTSEVLDLTFAITKEISRAKVAEGGVADHAAAELTAEKNRAIAAEGNRQFTPGSTEQKSLTDAILAETARADGVERQNAAAVVAEETRAKGVEATNAAAIAAETVRAKGVEGDLNSLRSDISDHSSLVGAINDVQDNFEDNKDAVLAETARATRAEGSLTYDELPLESSAAPFPGDHPNISAAIRKEIADRKAADGFGIDKLIEAAHTHENKPVDYVDNIINALNWETADRIAAIDFGDFEIADKATHSTPDTTTVRAAINSETLDRLAAIGARDYNIRDDATHTARHVGENSTVTQAINYETADRLAQIGTQAYKVNSKANSPHTEPAIDNPTVTQALDAETSERLAQIGTEEYLIQRSKVDGGATHTTPSTALATVTEALDYETADRRAQVGDEDYAIKGEATHTVPQPAGNLTITQALNAETRDRITAIGFPNSNTGFEVYNGKTHITDPDVDDVVSALNTETRDRLAAIDWGTFEISSKHTHATPDATTLRRAINSETLDRLEAIGDWDALSIPTIKTTADTEDLIKAINSEANERNTAIGSLSFTIDSSKTHATGSASDVTAAVNLETSDRQLAIGDLTTLNSGVTQTSVVAAINSENTRALTAEGDLDDAKISRSSVGLTGQRKQLLQEVELIRNGDSSLTLRRHSADISVDTQTDYHSDLAIALSEIRATVDQNGVLKFDADVLRDDVDQNDTDIGSMAFNARIIEGLTGVSMPTTLTEAINTENSRALNSESNITTRLETEENTRNANDGLLKYSSTIVSKLGLSANEYPAVNPGMTVTTEVPNLTAALNAEIERALAAESTMTDDKLARLEFDAHQIVTNLAWNLANQRFEFDAYDAVAKLYTHITDAGIPTVGPTSTGLMTTDMWQQLMKNKEDIAAITGVGGALNSTDFTNVDSSFTDTGLYVNTVGAPNYTTDPDKIESTQKLLTLYALQQVFNNGKTTGTIQWNDNSLGDSIYYDEGNVKHVANDIYSGTWVRSSAAVTVPGGGHRWELTNTEIGTPNAVFEWADVGFDTIDIASTTIAGVVVSTAKPASIVLDKNTWQSVAATVEVSLTGIMTVNGMEAMYNYVKAVESDKDDKFGNLLYTESSGSATIDTTMTSVTAAVNLVRHDLGTLKYSDDTSFGNVTAAVNGEISRAKTTEGTLAYAITTTPDSATSAAVTTVPSASTMTDLTTAVNAEINRSVAAENALKTRIDRHLSATLDENGVYNCDISMPHFWPKNTVIDFANAGLYGYRLAGDFTDESAVDKTTEFGLGDTVRMISCGGDVKVNDVNRIIPINSSYGENGVTQASAVLIIGENPNVAGAYDVFLTCYSDDGYSSNGNYDVWILYKK